MFTKTTFRLFKRLLLAISCFTILTYSQASPANLDCESAKALVEIFDEYHVEPKACNDTFSLQLFEQFLTAVDPSSNFLTDEDVAILRPYDKKLDDQIQSNSCEFLEKLTTIYTQRLNTIKLYIENELNTPFNLNSDENFVYGYSDNGFGFVDNDKKLKQWWRKRLKLEVLELAAEIEDLEKIKTLQSELQAKVKSKYLRKINKLINPKGGIDQHIRGVYLNSIATLYDPHSSFFSIADQDMLKSSLSAQVLSFGIEFTQNEADYIVVDRLIPGGPAWKSNQVHQGDILEKVTFQDGEQVEVYGYSVYELMEILATQNAFTSVFQFKNQAGIIKEVKLKKEKVRADDNIIKSFLLQGEQSVGYISLPGFYTEWGAGSNRGCAEDLARELTKLQLENISGLVIDLRYNGGGSLEEAIELAGIFIEEGVLFQVKDKEPILVKDPNRGSIYDGPLIILINEASASASEILSKALQDYNRAIIVGSTSYGKATGQNMMPVNDKIKIIEPSMNTIQFPRISGYAKVTTSKLYGVKGDSYQRQGIKPDIKLPSLIEGLVPTEGEEPYALINEPVPSANFFKPNKSFPLQKLSNQSAARVADSKSFFDISEANDTLLARVNKEKGYIPLNLVSFLKERKKERTFDSRIDNVGKQETQLFKVTNHRYDQALLDLDSYGSENNKILVENISSDVYIDEAYRIVLDLIQLQE